MRAKSKVKEQWATRLAFFIVGLGTASWAPLVPFARARVGIDEGGLGLLLLSLGAGSLIAMPSSGALAQRFGCKHVLMAAGLLMCCVLPLLATVSTIPTLSASLFLFGVAVGTFDCTTNIQAVIVERDSGRAMMSGFHGLYSLGGILGAGAMSALLVSGASPRTATIGISVLDAALLALAAPHFLRNQNDNSGPLFAVPRGVVLLIGVLCFIVFLTEGSMLDWSAVFLVTERGVDPTNAGLGYAAFAGAMTIFRLFGDKLVSRLQVTTVLVLGGLCAAVGLAVATLLASWPVALVGYALVGAGCANIVPVLYSAVGRQKRMPESIAVPAISTLGYAGILAGPALIGGVAHAVGLSVAFLCVAGAMVVVAASGRTLRRMTGR